MDRSQNLQTPTRKRPSIGGENHLPWDKARHADNEKLPSTMNATEEPHPDDLRKTIQAAFGGKAFKRPLFYAHSGGLRFSLSEGEHAIEQFLSAHRKASEICGGIFPGEGEITACLSAYLGDKAGTLAIVRPILRALGDAGIRIPRRRSFWLEEPDEGSCGKSLHVAFKAPARWLPRFLWCALSSDCGAIRPRPFCTVRLFNLDAGIMALPYDDRGMDVVGSDTERLRYLYHRYQAYLLAHDMDSMRNAFEPH